MNTGLYDYSNIPILPKIGARVTFWGTGGDKIWHRSAEANVWWADVEKSVSARQDWIMRTFEYSDISMFLIGCTMIGAGGGFGVWD